MIRVIIPTHNRCESLGRSLDALGAQTCAPGSFEVVAVADGCTDQTVGLPRRRQPPFAFRVVTQEAQGAAAARNNGAQQASGSLLLFLDDDIEPAPGLIEAHAQAHRRQPGGVVIGYSAPVLREQTDFLSIGLRQWWEAEFYAMRQPGHRFTYRDLLSGNFSIGAERFESIGGFDSSLCCREDYELGIRLMRARVPFAFAADAVGRHHETAGLGRSFRRTRLEGRADVQIGRLHPEMRAVFQLSSYDAPAPRLDRLLRRLAWAFPGGGDLLAAGLCHRLNFLEKARARAQWQRLCSSLRAYWYWRGVAEELRTPRALERFLREAAPAGDAVQIEIDLLEGLPEAERRLDEERPEGVCLRYGPHLIGTIPPQPGAERLRGAHLRPALAESLAWPLLTAIAVERSVGKEAMVSGAIPRWVEVASTLRLEDLSRSPVPDLL
jgi:glycosyltransferase involved in cell wall biosynthesis